MVRDLRRRGADLLSRPLSEQKRYGKEFVDVVATTEAKVRMSRSLLCHIFAILSITGHRRGSWYQRQGRGR
jgi:hypothetical protein